MNLTPHKTEDMLFTELLDVISAYEGILPLVSALGVLEVIKMKLISEVINADEDEDEDDDYED